jgi:hypothetical protein
MEHTRGYYATRFAVRAVTLTTVAAAAMTLPFAAAAVIIKGLGL